MMDKVSGACPLGWTAAAAGSSGGRTVEFYFYQLHYNCLFLISDDNFRCRLLFIAYAIYNTKILCVGLQNARLSSGSLARSRCMITHGMQ